MTASIARMNLVLHGVEDFEIARGDTLERARLHRATACAPSTWCWRTRPTPSSSGTARPGERPVGPQLPRHAAAGPRRLRLLPAHPVRSMDPKTGRCAILFPHGVLFRKEEAEMRRKLIEADLVECVLGLGPNLFYNSPMEAMRRLLPQPQSAEAPRQASCFIDAVNEVARERAMSFLRPEHQAAHPPPTPPLSTNPASPACAAPLDAAAPGLQPVDPALRQASCSA
jgi:type I restriction enzyme M protein